MAQEHETNQSPEEIKANFQDLLAAVESHITAGEKASNQEEFEEAKAAAQQALEKAKGYQKQHGDSVLTDRIEHFESLNDLDEKIAAMKLGVTEDEKESAKQAKAYSPEFRQRILAIDEDVKVAYEELQKKTKVGEPLDQEDWYRLMGVLNPAELALDEIIVALEEKVEVTEGEVQEKYQKDLDFAKKIAKEAEDAQMMWERLGRKEDEETPDEEQPQVIDYHQSLDLLERLLLVPLETEEDRANLIEQFEAFKDEFYDPKISKKQLTSEQRRELRGLLLEIRERIENFGGQRDQEVEEGKWPPQYLKDLLALNSDLEIQLPGLKTEVQALDLTTTDDSDRDRATEIESQLSTHLTELNELKNLVDLHIDHANGDVSEEAVKQLSKLKEASDKAETLRSKVVKLQELLEEKQIEASAKQELNDWEKEVADLINAIGVIENDVSLEKIKPHSDAPDAKGKAELESIKDQLEEEWDNADDADLFNAAGFTYRLTRDRIENLVGDDKKSGRYGEALKKINQAIEKTEAKTERVLAVEEMNSLWEVVEDNYQMLATKGENKVTEAIEKMKQIAKEKLTKEEAKLLDLTILLRDAVEAAGGPDWPVHLAWDDAVEARKTASSFVLMDHLQQFRNFGEIKFTDKEGIEHSVNIKEIVDKIHDVYFDGPYQGSYPDAAGKGPDNYHNYAAKGNPSGKKVYDEDNNPTGCYTIDQLITKDFSELDSDEENFPEFILESFKRFIIVSEMRIDKYIPEYALYTGSPVPGFDATGADDAAPMAGIMYKAQSGGSLPKHRVYAMVTRLPEEIETITDEEKDLTTGLPPGFGGPLDRVSSPLLRKVGMKEVTYKRAHQGNRNPDNLETLMMVRNRMIAEFSPYGIDFVQLHEDMKMQPTFWDWVNGEWRGNELGSISYFEFRTLQEEIRAFEKFVDSDFKSINSAEQLDTAIGQLVDYIKKFKTMFHELPEEDDSFAETVQLMSIVYLKKIFNRYVELLQKPLPEGAPASARFKRERLKPRLKRFAEITQRVLSEAGTLPKEVYNEGEYALEKVLNELDSYIASYSYWGTFFDDAAEVRAQGWKRAVERMWGPEFLTRYQNWMREPTIEEKDPNE